MSRPKMPAVYFSSRKTILTSNNTVHVARDADGDYSVTDEGTDTVIFLGNAQNARCVVNALGSLLDDNDEE